MLVGMDQWRFSRHQSFTAATARAKRPLAVTCRTMFFPFRDRPPDMGQAEEVEGGPIRCRMACVVFPQRAEIDDTCLVRLEREPKASKTLSPFHRAASAYILPVLNNRWGRNGKSSSRAASQDSETEGSRHG